MEEKESTKEAGWEFTLPNFLTRPMNLLLLFLLFITLILSVVLVIKIINIRNANQITSSQNK